MLSKRYLALGIIAIVLIASISYILLQNNKHNNPYGVSVELYIWVNGKLAVHKYNDLIKYNFANLTSYLHGYKNATFYIVAYWYYVNYTAYTQGKYSTPFTCYLGNKRTLNVLTTNEMPYASGTTDIPKWDNPYSPYTYSTPIHIPFLIGLNLYSSRTQVKVDYNSTSETNSYGCHEASSVYADPSTSAFGYIKNSTTRFGYWMKANYVNPSSTQSRVFNDTKLYLPLIDINNPYSDGNSPQNNIYNQGVFVRWLIIAEDMFPTLTLAVGDTATIQYIIWYN